MTSQSAGARLIAELSTPDDPYTLTFLIKLAGDVADEYEQYSMTLSGDRATWTEVKMGAKTVEVVVTDVMRQRRAAGEQLRKLLATITAQRAASPAPSSGNDDLAGLT
jgi:ribosomal protein S11